jgi:hypothetical protein
MRLAPNSCLGSRRMQAGSLQGISFDLDQTRLSGSVVPIAASTANGRRPARVLASRRIVDCGLHALAGSAIR